MSYKSISKASLYHTRSENTNRLLSQVMIYYSMVNKPKIEKDDPFYDPENIWLYKMGMYDTLCIKGIDKQDIHRFYGSIVAMNILSVQPMNGPQPIFSLRVKYKDDD